MITIKHPTTGEDLRVFVQHERWPVEVLDLPPDEVALRFPASTRELREKGCEISPRGGYTVVSLWDVNDETVAVGEATCHIRDNFNRRLGRTIALGRALKELQA